MPGLSRWTVVSGAILLTAGGLFAAGNVETPAPNRTEQQSALMLAKLASSQRITSGLVNKDFDEIRRGAEELNRICNATEWAARGDQIYAHHRTELRRQSSKLIKMADDRNLDGAAFTYMHSLTTCISCHEYCRDVLRIADDQTPMKVVPIPVRDDQAIRSSDRPVRR